MAAGILLAPRSPGSRKKRFGMKPKFYDVWLDQGGEKWNEMMVRELTSDLLAPCSFTIRYTLLFYI
jgi:hypothetical protein